MTTSTKKEKKGKITKAKFEISDGICTFLTSATDKAELCCLYKVFQRVQVESKATGISVGS